MVEVKHYRYSSPPSITLFDRALKQARYIKSGAMASRGLLAISCPLTSRLADAAKVYTEIEIWDASHLLKQASAFPELLRAFEQLFEITASVVAEFPLRQVGAQWADPFNKLTKGKKIAEALKVVKPGRQEAGDFEQACIDALRYLFDTDLHGWHEQHDTEDGLHRRDLVCRILPNSEVWRLMLTDLRSRYVVFEFKNYTHPITQKEVITTERYLYPSALRNVAIMISPKGCASSAEKVIQGAMREHGKLILSLTVSELERLLISKDEGSDPNTYLFEQVDNFLMRLGR